jgi:hypothetical protein
MFVYICIYSKPQNRQQQYKKTRIFVADFTTRKSVPMQKKASAAVYTARMLLF